VRIEVHLWIDRQAICFVHSKHTTIYEGHTSGGTKVSQKKNKRTRQPDHTHLSPPRLIKNFQTPFLLFLPPLLPPTPLLLLHLQILLFAYLLISSSSTNSSTIPLFLPFAPSIPIFHRHSHSLSPSPVRPRGDDTTQSEVFGKGGGEG